MSEIADRVRQHYEREAMDPDRLADVLEAASRERVAEPVQTTVEPAEERGDRKARLPVLSQRPLSLVLWAALVLGAIGLGALTARESAAGRQVRSVAAEIALNHRKALALDVETSSFAELGTAMNLLDFTPLAPVALADEGWRLVGARYCSIGGAIAAQARLLDAAGRRATLYELRPVDGTERIERADVEVDGLRVTLWREGGLLLGLARPLEGAGSP